MGSQTPPEQQQYCLRWNNYQNNLTNVFDQLLQAEAFVDVTLSAEGHSLKAHKVVLSACSPYFQALFFDNPCKHPIVILNGVKWLQLKALTEFMYRGEINVAQDHLAPLLKVAELLKIRGLADVSHSRSGNNAFVTSASAGSAATATATTVSSGPSSQVEDKKINPADFLSNSNSPESSSVRRKRRKVSTPERTPSPLEEEDELERETDDGLNLISNPSISMSVNPINSAEFQRVLASNPALMNLHAAAAAAAAAVAVGGGGGGGGAGVGGGGASSGQNDSDIKPGIVEMIREEERAKMLESAHGWMAPGSSSTLSESYQYQIQNLWQKCWNQNQNPGMMHALRFRERGPLKSWRPETMAEAIFAVLREGLSLSQAARKYDIPYPTFVLYANRVHNMLGPSADGSTSSDLMSDMRPKGRGRPQRILLGSWPEEHIRGVIRAVVFREATQTKDCNETPPSPFLFNRDGTLLIPPPQSPSGGGGPNGVDMTLHTADNSRNSSSSTSSASSSPLQQALTANLNLTAHAQSQLLAFQHQQRQLQQGQQLQQQHSGFGKGAGTGVAPFSLGNLAGFLNLEGGGKALNESMKDILQLQLQIKEERQQNQLQQQQAQQGASVELDSEELEEKVGEDLRKTPQDKVNNNENGEKVVGVVEDGDGEQLESDHTGNQKDSSHGIQSSPAR